MFPYTRLRRVRKHEWIRDMVAETLLSPADLVLPVFICEDENLDQKIDSLPGVKRYNLKTIDSILQEATESGVSALALFPVISKELKSEDASESYNQENLICRTIRHIKNKNPKIGVICDVALDPYTTHGHDGILSHGNIDNDQTIEALQNQALSLAKAGADCLAPSDMMDGRIGSIREILEENNFTDLAIISYAAKYASSFYSPFRDALGSTDPLAGADKKTYQMDFRNSKEALREIELDIEEGADAVIIKPGSLYLDIINQAYKSFNIPIFAYHVSGEYSMLKIAAEARVLDFDKCLIEVLTGIKRAGASSILTYGAIEAAKILNGKK
jgi:porphobilinogen synthase